METERFLFPKKGNWLNDDWRFTEELPSGEKATAVVWKVRHKTTETYAAVKMLKVNSRNDTGATNQFRRTSRVMLQQLHHPNICGVDEFVDTSRYGPWFRMEFISNGHLLEYCRTMKDSGQQLSPLQLCDLLKPVAEALDFAHNKGVLHSDINQHHLMVHLTRQGVVGVKLIDFGEALVLDQQNHDSDSDWPSSGTPGYISPERLQGKPQCGRSDQYSFAVVVHELFLGYLPNQEKFIAAKQDAAVCSITFNRRDLMAAFRRGLAPYPAGRFDTCCEFLDAVRVALDMDQPISGSLLRSCVGLQKQKTGPVSQQTRFWEQPDFQPRRRHADPRKDCQNLQKVAHSLRQEYQSLQQELGKLEKDPVKVGIVGTRNAGKTSLFAVWNLIRNSLEDAVDLVIADDDTASYLKGISAELLQQGGVRANPYGSPPTFLKMKVTVHDRTWPLITCDFTGEFLNPETNRESEEAAETLKFLREADLIIFLFDPDPGPAKADWKILDHIDRLFHEIPPELVLAVTKIDEHWGAREELGYARFVAIYEELCCRNPLLEKVANKLYHSFCLVGLKIIPISSFGKKLSPRATQTSGLRNLSVDDLKPFQVFSPLAAAFQRRADDVKRLQYRLEQLRRKVLNVMKQLNDVEAAAKERQNQINSLVAEIERAGREIEAVIDSAKKEKSFEILKEYQSSLRPKTKDLRSLGGVEDATKCQPVLDRLNWAVTNFPLLVDECETKELLKFFTDQNKRPIIEFVLFWLMTSHASWSLAHKVAAGVPDAVKDQFNEQYSLYIRRSMRIAGTMILGIVLFFFFLLTR